MNYCAYGKTIQNVRKRTKVRLVNNAKDYTNQTTKRRLFSQKIFDKHFVAIHEPKPVLALDKLIYTRFSTLNVSKSLMYEFHYSYIKRKLSVKLSFTDKDSLVYETKTSDVYEGFYEDKNFSDFRDYPQDTHFFDPVNKNVIGKMKDEFKGNITSEFAG